MQVPAGYSGPKPLARPGRPRHTPPLAAWQQSKSAGDTLRNASRHPPPRSVLLAPTTVTSALSLQQRLEWITVLLKVMATEVDTEVAAHRAVLSAASPYFLAMFTQFTERTLPTVTIQDLASAGVGGVGYVLLFIARGDVCISEWSQTLLAGASLVQVWAVWVTCCSLLPEATCVSVSGTAGEASLVRVWGEWVTCGSLLPEATCVSVSGRRRCWRGLASAGVGGVGYVWLFIARGDVCISEWPQALLAGASLVQVWGAWVTCGSLLPEATCVSVSGRRRCWRGLASAGVGGVGYVWLFIARGDVCISEWPQALLAGASLVQVWGAWVTCGSLLPEATCVSVSGRRHCWRGLASAGVGGVGYVWLFIARGDVCISEWSQALLARPRYMSLHNLHLLKYGEFCNLIDENCL
ncbi:hypothetical protein ACJJTC_009704 [Scirpophaga incertulas]